MRARQCDIFGAVDLVTGAVGFDVHLVGNVELRLPVFERARLRVRQVPLAQLGERLHRRGGPEAREPFVEIALHAVLEDHRATRIHPLRPIGAPANLPAQEIPTDILVDYARNVGWIDDNGTSLPENRDGLGHRLRLLRVQPAARLLQARRLDALIIERAWNADACPRQRIAIEKASVVAVLRRRTSLDRIPRVRLLVLNYSEQNGGIVYSPRHWARGILVGGERNDAVPADAPDRGLDRDQHGQL